MAKETQIDLSLIIVSWNVRDLLQDCVNSIIVGRGHLNVEVVIVDSASSDGSPQMVQDEFPQDRFPWIHLIACDNNVGFPKGNNIGLKTAVGRHILLLNPDTIVLGAALPQMVNYMDANPDIGVLGPQLLNPDKASNHHAVVFRQWQPLFLRAVGLNHMLLLSCCKLIMQKILLMMRLQMWTG